MVIEKLGLVTLRRLEKAGPLTHHPACGQAWSMALDLAAHSLPTANSNRPWIDILITGHAPTFGKLLIALVLLCCMCIMLNLH